MPLLEATRVSDLQAQQIGLTTKVISRIVLE